jgi:phosphosulfolactate synthase (CoM biosynthesis protein A)
MKAKSKNAERSFPFLRVNEREGKPRKRGLTEIRGPYYSVVGRRYLEDLFEMMGTYVDSLKFAGGAFTLMPERAVREIVDLCHKHNVLVSTGGFIERVLTQAARPCGNMSPNAGSSVSTSSKSQLVLSRSQLTIGCA